MEDKFAVDTAIRGKSAAGIAAMGTVAAGTACKATVSMAAVGKPSKRVADSFVARKIGLCWVLLTCVRRRCSDPALRANYLRLAQPFVILFFITN